MLSSSISKLDGFVANPGSKKRQRSDVLSSERPGVNLEKMRDKLHGRTHDLRNQRMEQRPENAGFVKRPRTSTADGQVCILHNLIVVIFMLSSFPGNQCDILLCSASSVLFLPVILSGLKKLLCISLLT